MTDHTPGPWNIAANQMEDHLHWIAQGSDGLGKYIAGVHHDNPTNPDAEAQANARLIAQSPRMYGILKEILVELEDASIEWKGARLYTLLKQAERILAKAEGGTQ